MTLPSSASWLLRDGLWHPCPGVPATDRGFRHGMSVFETLRILDGRLLFLEQHLAKLRQATHLTGLRLPPAQLAHDLPPLAASCPEGIARIYVTAGDGDFIAPTDQGRLVFLIEPRPAPVTGPIRLHLHPEPFTPVWPGLKTGNYWNHLHAWHTARQAGFDEAVLVNPADHVISAAMANLFAVIDGILMTPRPATGARSGVIRDWVTDCTDAVVADFHPEQLLGATEIFLTNSGSGIRPVRQFQHHTLPDDSVARSLQSAYAAAIKDRSP